MKNKFYAIAGAVLIAAALLVPSIALAAAGGVITLPRLKKTQQRLTPILRGLAATTPGLKRLKL